jgi:hypothetical protein
MAFQFALTANTMQIAELQYAAAAAIQFTGFSSCIGVIGQITGQNQVFGVHVPLITGAGEMFAASDVAAIQAVLQTLNANPATVMVIGQLSVWEASNPAGYAAVLTAWPAAYPLAQGVYGATLDPQGDLEITTMAVAAVIPLQVIAARDAAVAATPPTQLQAEATQQQALQEASSQAAASAAQIAAQGAEAGTETSGVANNLAAQSSAQAALAAQIQAEQAEEQSDTQGSAYQ